MFKRSPAICTKHTCVKRSLSKRQKLVFKTNYLNAGQKYCSMLQGEHSSILSTFIKVSFVFNTFVLPTFEWPFYTGFTVYASRSLERFL